VAAFLRRDLETTYSPDHRSRVRGTAPEQDAEPRHEYIEDDGIPRRKGPHWSVSFLIVVIVVIAIPLGIATVALTVALVFGFIWLSYTGLLLPALRTQEAVIGLDPGPRLMIVVVWLLLTAVAAAVLIGVGGIRGTTSVGWALTAAVGSVVVAFALTSWVIA